MNRHGQLLLDFNKEILIGELGAVVGSQVFSFFATFLGDPEVLVPYLVVLGAFLGSASLFIISRYFDERKRHSFSKKKFVKDLGYYSVGAFILTVVIYYPLFFSIEKVFLGIFKSEVYATFSAQLIAFLSFVVFINAYRLLLIWLFDEEL